MLEIIKCLEKSNIVKDFEVLTFEFFEGDNILSSDSISCEEILKVIKLKVIKKNI